MNILSFIKSLFAKRDEHIKSVEKIDKQIEEALYRLVESYHIIGVEEEAKRYAAVLGSNYPEGKWFKYAYKLINRKK